MDSLADASGRDAILLLLFLAPLVPGVAAFAGRIVCRLGALGRKGSILASLIFAVPFLVFRSNNTMLGDTQLYAKALTEGLDIASSLNREPGSVLIASVFHRTAGRALGLSGETTLVAVSVFFGVLFVYLALELSRELARSLEGRALVAATLLTLGTLQVYFGYTEYYGIVSVAGLLYSLLALRWARGRGTLYAVALALALAVFAHFMALLLVPSFVYLLFLEYRRRGLARSMLGGVLAPAVLLVLLLVARYPLQEIGQVLGDAAKLFARKEGGVGASYAVSFGPQLMNAFNILLLTAPCAFLLAVVGLAASRSGERAGVAPEVLLTGTMAGGAVLHMIFFTPDLGACRDWDIYALPSIIISVFVVVLVLTRSMSRNVALWLAGAVAITGAAHLGLWVRGNHSQDHLVPRFTRLAHNERLWSENARGKLWLHLGTLAGQRGDAVSARESWMQAVRVDPEYEKLYRIIARADMVIQSERIRSSLARSAATSQSAVDGKAMLRRAVQLGLREYYSSVLPDTPRRDLALLGAGYASLEILGPDSLTVGSFQRAVDEYPEDPEVSAVWGDMLRRLGRIDEAEMEYRKVLQRSPRHIRARLGLACISGMRGDRDEVLRIVDEVLGNYPWSLEAQMLRRKAYSPGGLEDAEDFKKHFYFK